MDNGGKMKKEISTVCDSGRLVMVDDGWLGSPVSS